MFERYNERARRAIFFARWWALNRSSRTIGTGDLILGVVHESADADGPYAQLYAQRDAFVALFDDGIVPVAKPTPNDIPLTDNSKKALAYAAMEADLDGRTTIDPFHLFRGVLCTGDDTAEKLIAAGHSLESVRETCRLAFPKLPDSPGKIRFVGTGRPSGQMKFALAVGAVIFLAVLLYLRSQN